VIIKHGLISCDSHVLLEPEAYTSRMSRARWGDLIPEMVEVMDPEEGRLVHRWKTYGKVRAGNERGFNCPAALENERRDVYPKRWDEVPLRAYDPLERAEAQDVDGVDAEVLFNMSSFYQFGDAEYELDAIRATNDAVAAWRAAIDRYIPLTEIPMLSGTDAAVAEIERAARQGCGGINMLSEPSTVRSGFKHISDRYWDPIWDVCQDLGLPVNIHASGGLGSSLRVPRWSGHGQYPDHDAHTTGTSFWPAQIIPTLIFSGITDRFPRHNFVFAEAGVGAVYYAIEACDREWERSKLWKEGLPTRPSEIVRRQMYVNFWFEVAGPEMHERLSADNLMWESDYPHIVSTYPKSWEWVERAVGKLPESDRRKMLYENAVRLYKLSPVSAQPSSGKTMTGAQPTVTS